MRTKEMLKTEYIERVYRPRGLKKHLKEIIEKQLGRLLIAGETYKLDIKLLPRTSKDKVLIECDYCYKRWEVPYSQYTQAMTISFTKTISCNKCKYKKRREEANYKQAQGILKQGDLHYWGFEENRIKALDEWLKEEAGKSTIFDTPIYTCYKQYNADIWKDIKKLGYNEDEIRLVKHNRWWYDFDNVKSLIENFMKEKSCGRFPTQKDFRNNLRPTIPSTAYMYHGGITGMKAKMKHIDNDAILDIKGKQHKSSYEAILANFLIAHNIDFIKEARIVLSEPYLSDFDITKSTNYRKRLLIEIWGFNQDKTDFNKDYNAKREIKEKVYNNFKNEITLISFEPSHFKGSYMAIAENIYNILSNYIELSKADFKNIDLTPRGKEYLTLEKIEELIKSYSHDGVTLPSSEELEKLNYTVYKAIIKRFGTLEVFASSIDMKVVRVPPGYWTLEKIFEAFDEMYKNEGEYIRNTKHIKSDELLKEKYGRLIDASFSNGNGGWNRVWKQYLESRKKMGLIPSSVTLEATRVPSGYWTLEKIFEAFDEMYKNEGRYIMNSAEIMNNPLLKGKYSRVYFACKKKAGWKNCWEQYFEDERYKGIGD